MAENIAGKIVVITGASSGLGAATARHLVREGAKVVLGAVATELPDHVSEPSVARGMQDVYEKHAIPADSFARCVFFTRRQPEAVDINEILSRPTSREL